MTTSARSLVGALLLLQLVTASLVGTSDPAASSDAVARTPADPAQVAFTVSYDRHGTKSASRKVQLQLGVMSKCPDAFFCEAIFQTVLAAPVSHKVELEMLYIGQ